MSEISSPYVSNPLGLTNTQDVKADHAALMPRTSCASASRPSRSHTAPTPRTSSLPPTHPVLPRRASPTRWVQPFGVASRLPLRLYRNEMLAGGSD
ncbi:hypothetical protein B0H19DRAFT_1272315 [Mycena capillaripes]|nr:hypothetical protein B0H19DRAFT_1272315 [Mycena capillaripes]